MLSWAAVAELAQAGFEIGSHGKFISRPTSTRLNSSDVMLLASKTELEQQVGQAVLELRLSVRLPRPAGTAGGA